MSGAVETEAIPKPEALDRKCDICGAEIRLGSQFCYNCGSEIREEAVEESAAETSDDVSADEEKAVSSETADVEEPPKKPVRSSVRRHRPVKAKETTIRWEEPEGVGLGSIAVVALIVALAAVLIAVGFYIR